MDCGFAPAFPPRSKHILYQTDPIQSKGSGTLGSMYGSGPVISPEVAVSLSETGSAESQNCKEAVKV